MCGKFVKLVRYTPMTRLVSESFLCGVSQIVEGADDRAFLRMHPPPLEKGTVGIHLRGAVQ